MADESADDRWTVRGVSKAYQRKAAEAAHRRKISVGAHVCRALDLAEQAERQPLDLILPHRPADKTADTADGLSDAAVRLALVERTIQAAVALAGAPDVPKALRQRANRLLREGLPAPLLKERVKQLPAPPMANGARSIEDHRLDSPPAQHQRP